MDTLPPMNNASEKGAHTIYSTFQKSFMLIRQGPLKVPANNSSQGSLVLVKKTTLLLLNLEVVTVQKLRRSLVSQMLNEKKSLIPTDSYLVPL